MEVEVFCCGVRGCPATANWEPTTQEVKSAVVHLWLTVESESKVIVHRLGASFASREIVGLLVAPAEAHWLLGVEGTV